jgi:hypothetical protein
MASDRQEVVVTDIRMPFFSMVIFMVKWAFAAIPALIILSLIWGLIMALFGGVMGGFWHMGHMGAAGEIRRF